MASSLPSKHESERAFFDNWAANKKAEVVSQETIRRYRNPGHKFPLEMMFRLAGDLRGKSVLDVGCGDGVNAVVLGLIGAHVTGIDISPGAINLARERCAVNGVKAEFICSPLEEFTDLGRKFDIVWVDALLHHMLHDLPATLRLLGSALAPGGVILMKEPVNLCKPLRKARLLLGPPPDATPDERPLEVSDIDCLRSHFSGLEEHRFYLLGRLNPWFKSHKARSAIAAFDAVLLSLPLIGQLASVSVFAATAPKLPQSGRN